VRGAGVVLRPPMMSDYSAWAELRNRSREHLMAYEPLWAADELSRGAFRRRVRHYQREMREEQGYAFFIFDDPNQSLLGGATLSNIRRGVSQSASLGYWIGAPYTRRGLMSAALEALLPFAFEGLRLHRIEAACLPDNVASAKVLARAGFDRVGLARSYLQINGRWQDHIVFSLAAEDWQRQRSGRP
jgi:ribosomal-protein-alanine N-acetyltransferase